MKHRSLLLFILVFSLACLGVLFVYDASVAEAYQQFNNKFYFARQQLMWLLLGVVGCGIASIVPIKVYKALSLPLFFVVVLCLVAVLIPGIGDMVQGARRWIVLGSFRFQPSELTKIGVVLYFSAWLSKHQKIKPFLAITGAIFGLIMLQPDLGTALVVGAIAVSMYFAAGGSVRHLIFLAIIGTASIGLLIITSPYRMQRIQAFLDPESDPLGSSYHIRQLVIALGSGGMFGQGIGQSKQKYQYIPEASTDSIFAIIAEEIGFVGGILLILMYLAITKTGFTIAEHADDPYSRLVAIGITSWIGSQALLNLASVVALVPLTGVPLPFVSYGGSALLTTLAASGILMGIGRKGTR